LLHVGKRDVTARCRVVQTAIRIFLYQAEFFSHFLCSPESYPAFVDGELGDKSAAARENGIITI
jgi:hypothetical protein